MNAEHVPTVEFDRNGEYADDVAKRIADAAWSIASLRDGPDFRLIVRGPVDAGTTRTVLARLDEVLSTGERIVTIDVAGLWATHDQVAHLLGEAQSHAADRGGLVVAVGVHPVADPGIRSIGE